MELFPRYEIKKISYYILLGMPLLFALLFEFYFQVDKRHHFFNEVKTNYLIAQLSLMVAGCCFIVLYKYKKLLQTYLQNLYLIKLWPWVLYLLFILVLINIFRAPFLRMNMFLAVSMVFVIIFYPPLITALFSKHNLLFKVTVVFLILSFSAMVLPGFYLPPFFNGIAGWTSAGGNKDQDQITLNDLQLVRKDGKTIWYSIAFISPGNYLQRQLGFAAMKKDNIKYAQLFEYYFNLYKRHFPLLLQDKYPNQKFLSQFAYPGHSTYRMLSYKDFPPDEIVEIVWAEEVFDTSKYNLVKRKVLVRYDVQTRKLIQ